MWAQKDMVERWRKRKRMKLNELCDSEISFFLEFGVKRLALMKLSVRIDYEMTEK